jgi:hypothetical protein
MQAPLHYMTLSEELRPELVFVHFTGSPGEPLATSGTSRGPQLPLNLPPHHPSPSSRGSSSSSSSRHHYHHILVSLVLVIVIIIIIITIITIILVSSDVLQAFWSRGLMRIISIVMIGIGIVLITIIIILLLIASRHSSCRDCAAWVFHPLRFFVWAWVAYVPEPSFH